MVISTILFYMAYNPGSGGSYRRFFRRQEYCFSNLRTITEAIKNYNQDNTMKISELNDSTFETLVKEGYLKCKPYHPEPSKCEYASEGNLTNKGYVYCKYHGDLDKIRNCEFNEKYNIEDYKHDQALNMLKVFGICVGPAILFIIVNII